MGFQTFTCVICGASCTRRTSKRYKDGRACNTHSEVQEEQQEKTNQLLKTELINLFTHYRDNVGIKHPDKEKLKEWINSYITELRSKLTESVAADRSLSLYKTSGLITLQYEVTDKFVSILSDIIKAHEEDTNWVDKKALKKEYRSMKAKKPERKTTDQSSEEASYKIKEHRGAKEAPRRRSASRDR